MEKPTNIYHTVQTAVGVIEMLSKKRCEILQKRKYLYKRVINIVLLRIF